MGSYDILKANNAKMIVKSKSMLTEECHLNPFLESKGIEVVDKISVVKTNKSDKPLQDVRVLKMKLVR